MDQDEMRKKINEIIKNNPELNNFNLDFLRNMSPDEIDEIIEKLKKASVKFTDAEKKVKNSLMEIYDIKISDLTINEDTYINTLSTFPFALAVGEDILDDDKTSGEFKGKLFGKDIKFSYENIFELISVKKAISLFITRLLRTNFGMFLPFKNDLKEYIKSTAVTYFNIYGFADDFIFTEIKEYNFIVFVKPVNFDTTAQYFEAQIDETKSELFKYLKAYLITEFSIAIIEK